MGFFKSIGKGALGLAKGTAIGTARISADIAEGVGKATTSYGTKVLSNAVKNPKTTALAIGGIAALGYGLADMDDRNDGAKVAMKGAIGAAALSAIPGATSVMAGVATGAVGAAAGVAGFASGLGQKMITAPDVPVNLNNLGDIKFSKLGKGLLVGSAVFEGASRAVNKFEQIRMGTNDNMMRKATPVIPTSSTPSYANNGGATGDLVFSMYNNR